MFFFWYDLLASKLSKSFILWISKTFHFNVFNWNFNLIFRVPSLVLFIIGSSVWLQLIWYSKHRNIFISKIPEYKQLFTSCTTINLTGVSLAQPLKRVKSPLQRWAEYPPLLPTPRKINRYKLVLPLQMDKRKCRKTKRERTESREQSAYAQDY